MVLQGRVGQFASSLIPVAPTPDALPPDLPDGIGEDYLEFLATTNGGYTGDYLFHLFGISGPREHDVVRWNLRETWKASFGLDERSFVFAEDVIGNQYYFQLGSRRKVAKVFCIDDGTSLPCADNFPSFVENVIGGDEVTSEPRRLFGAFLRFSHLQYPLFTHLSSKIPACLGGDDTDLGNIEFANSIAHLNFMGQLIDQLKGLPQGAVVKDVNFDKDAMKLKPLFEFHEPYRISVSAPARRVAGTPS